MYLKNCHNLLDRPFKAFDSVGLKASVAPRPYFVGFGSVFSTERCVGIEDVDASGTPAGISVM
jgi:hypothetical protein